MSVTARNRPRAHHAWRGTSMLIVDNAGRSGTGEFQGWFFRETRYLHDLRLEANGHVPFVSAIAQAAPNEIAATYIFPPVPPEGTGSGTGGETERYGLLTRDLDLYLRYRVHAASLECILHVSNRWQERAEFELAWVLSADYADPDAARSGQRKQDAPVLATPEENGVAFRYPHDQLPFETRIRAEGGGVWSFQDGRLAAKLTLERQQVSEIRLVARAVDPEDPIDEEGEQRREEVLRGWHERATRLWAPGEPQLVAVAEQAVHDLGSMALLDDGEEDWLAPAAGYPLFPSLWARDALTASWQAAVFDRGELVEATLPTLARLQGTTTDPERAEQPGRIIRQHRKDPRARLGETPFDRYYADFASPFMFIIALGNAYAWSGKKALLERYFDNARRVLDWARDYGDRDGDGFVEYLNPSRFGPPHEGWKDSGNAVVHADGSQVEPPIAPAEIQGYWHAALRFMAVFSAILGHRTDALDHWRAAADLRERFDRHFWLDHEGVPAFGLDAEKRPIESVVSNAGHCLTSGILKDDKIPRVVRRLFEPDMFSGWGIRTLSSKNPAYNPQSYHLGSVWAVENGTILFGLRRYGFRDRTHELARALFDLALLWHDRRIPEAVGGYARAEFPFPGAYPRANAPQAWNQSVWPILIQTLLGMRPVAALDLLAVDPDLPVWLPELTLKGLRVGGATADLRFWRDDGGDSHFEVLRKEGTLRILRQPPIDSLHAGLWDRLGALAASVLPM